MEQIQLSSFCHIDQGIVTEKHTISDKFACNKNCCCFLNANGGSNTWSNPGSDDQVTNAQNGNATTISGGPKWFGCGKENRIQLTLDLDQHTLEFRLLKEEESFWKVRLAEEWKNVRIYPMVGLGWKDMTAKFYY